LIASPPAWFAEAERVGNELRVLIEGEIRIAYAGNAPLYIRERFGSHALKSIIAISESNFERLAPPVLLKTFCAAMLLRYAVNRSAYRVLATKAGYRDPRIYKRSRAVGTEAIAVLTQNGSMVFANTGCLTGERAFCYLPIAGREVKPVWGLGRIVPARWAPDSSDTDGGLLKLWAGLIPIPGQTLTVPRDGRGPWHTSQMAEVKVKHGDPDDPGDWEQTTAAIHSLTTLNLGLTWNGPELD
jgi:hypothetical protein